MNTKYVDDLDYLMNIKIHFLVITLVFIFSTAAGFMYSSMHPESSMLSLEGVNEFFELIKNLPPIGIMIFIFLNNAIKSLIILMLGLGFGVIPLLFIA